ncbi:hypothetical protein [Zhihengliuella sp.]|uniref:hypothetical protein n=1 Tax=Zhihengliuella sp. TaxID=1954483 RepID=UPI00281245A1|nr:hypothetical protein [Zhihengliuella sp.]
MTDTGSSLTHLVKALADWSLEHPDTIAWARQEYDVQHPDNEIQGFPATTTVEGRGLRLTRYTDIIGSSA